MKRETKAERKFKLFTRLQAMGFTYEEAYQLRRIEMTLSKWAEHECNGDIQRDEKTGKPYRYHGRYLQANDPRNMHFVADREAGALKRLKAIVDARNLRICPPVHVSNAQAVIQTRNASEYVYSYHQSDPRGCALYLLKQSDIREGERIDSIYTRGLAVCE